MNKRNLFNEEQRAFRNTVSKFVEKEILPYHSIWEKDGFVPKELWLKAGEAGILCPNVPEIYGGSGGDFRYNVVVNEELSKVGATGPGFTVHSDIVSPYIVNYGTKEQKNTIIPKMISGEIVTAIAMTEPGTGSDLQSIKTKVKRVDNEIVLSGSKTFITNGQTADLIIVVAKTGTNKKAAGISLVLCESERKGFRRGRNLEKIGLKAQDTSELFFEDVHLPFSNILGKEGNGFFHLMDELPQERLSIAVTAIASAEAALEWTINYVKEREAFNTKLINFQNTKFILAQLKTDVTVARIYIDKCIKNHLDKNFNVVDAAMAKLWSTELQCMAIDKCLQLHGGYGYMWEYPIARAYADSRVQKIYGGSNEIMKEIISRSL